MAQSFDERRRAPSNRDTSPRKEGIGALAAIFATFAWSLNFVSPSVTDFYTAFDLVVVRFVFCGVLGAVLVWANRAHLPGFGGGKIMLAAVLGMVGYAGYVACIMGAVVFAGLVIPPAIMGLVPVVVAVTGNVARRAVPWCYWPFRSCSPQSGWRR